MAEQPKLTAKQINDAALAAAKKPAKAEPAAKTKAEPAEPQKIIVTKRALIKDSPDTVTTASEAPSEVEPEVAKPAAPVATPEPKPEPAAPAAGAPAIAPPSAATKTIMPLPSSDAEPEKEEEPEAPAEAEAKPADAPDPDAAPVLEGDEATKRVAELIESGEYFLPINTVEKRRNKRVAIAGTVLVLLLAAGWLVVSLDAGLIKIDGVEPVTDFLPN